MEEYFIGNKANSYSDSGEFKQRKNIFNKKYLIIGLVLFVVILIIVLVLKNNSPDFSLYEKQLVTSAKEYVNNNGINTDKEIYIDVSKLNVDLGNSCSLLSGVIYNGNDYIPYLLCNKYESEIVNNDIDNSNSNFRLIGNSVEVLLKGMEYNELGYESNEPVSITNNNIIDEGVYNIYYVVENSSLVFTRKVIVMDNPSLINSFPAINISNKNAVTIEKGSEYNESVTAIDSIDGDITNKIKKTSNIDINTPGVYKVVYSVRNSLGYTAYVMKKVIVVDSNSEMDIITSLSNDNITNESIKANIKIVGGSYNYTKLPDGTTISEREFEYPINENGEYEFIAVANDDTEISKVLNVTNIDKVIPEGTCEVTLYNDKTSINVTITSFNYIAGYNYYVDNDVSGYIEYNYYNSNKKNPTEVYVMVKDYVGNEGKIECTKSDKKSSFDPQGYRTVLTQPARLTFAITDALARKGYTFDDFNKCIYNRVKEAGPYTRYGVAAAAFGLIDCSYTMTGYRLPYNHTASKVGDPKSCQDHADICGKLGASPRWGTPGGQCGLDKNGQKRQCYQGHNCATFVHWAMCNGGMDLCSRGDNTAFGMADIKYFPEADAVGIKGSKVTHVYGVDYSNLPAATLVRMLKPGDIIASSEGDGHVFVVVGYDDNGIYTAEDGYYMRNLKYSALTNGKESYRLMFLDRYYANPNNYNYLYG